MATSAPFSAKARAIAAPRPRAPPVTSIVLPAKVWALLISPDSISPRCPQPDRTLTDVITNNMLPIGTVSMVVLLGTFCQEHVAIYIDRYSMAACRGRRQAGSRWEDRLNLIR